jgi:hypothetical protein
MRRAKLVLNFIRFAILSKIAFYRNVIAKMKGNPLFPNPDVNFTEAEASIDSLETAYQKALDGNAADTAIMHQVEEGTDKLFRKIAAYVERIADDDETIILQAGFNLSKNPSPSQRPILTVEDGDKPGSVWLRRKAVPGSRSYIWQIAVGSLPTSEKEWATITASTQVEAVIEGLEIGVRHFFRSAAVTPDGTTAFCEPISRIVQ